MRATYRTSWEDIFFRIVIAVPTSVALVYVWEDSTDIYAMGLISLAFATLLLIRPWQIATVFLPVLLIIAAARALDDRWSWEQILFIFIVVLLLLRIAWWWEHRRANQKDARIQSANVHKSRFRFALWEMLWFVTLVSLIGALTVEMYRQMHTRHVEQAEFAQLKRDFGDMGGVIRRGTTAHSRSRCEIVFGAGPLTEKRLIELLNRTRDKYGVRRLILTEQPIGDAAVEVIATLDGLQILDLQSTNVTDEGLVCLRGMGIVNLDLSHTQITDASVERLKKMPTLRALKLEETDLSEEAVEELRAALPRTSIYWSPPNTSPAAVP